MPPHAVRPIPTADGGRLARAAEAARYAACAGASFAADWGAWAVLWHVSGDAIAAQSASRLVGALVAFTLYRRVAFRAPGGPAAAHGVRFAAAAAASWALSVALVGLLGWILPAPLAKAAADGTTFCANYAMMRCFVFAPRRREAAGTVQA